MRQDADPQPSNANRRAVPCAHFVRAVGRLPAGQLRRNEHGAQVDWSPTEVKKNNKDGDAAGGGGGRGLNANVGKTPAMMAMVGGRGAPFAAGPGFERLIAPPFREPSNRDPGEALKVLLDAGANPNAKTSDGATLLHQAV